MWCNAGLLNGVHRSLRFFGLASAASVSDGHLDRPDVLNIDSLVTEFVCVQQARDRLVIALQQRCPIAPLVHDVDYLERRTAVLDASVHVEYDFEPNELTHKNPIKFQATGVVSEPLVKPRIDRVDERAGLRASGFRHV